MQQGLSLIISSKHLTLDKSELDKSVVRYGMGELPSTVYL